MSTEYRRSIVVFGLVAALVFAGIAGASRAASGSHEHSAVIPLFVMATDSPPTGATLDPAQMYNQITASPIFEGLLKLSPDGKLLPNLAQSVATPKPGTYVFHLRHDVKFWDGNTMTSADVVTSLQHEAEPKASSSSEFTNVKSFVANDPYTVTITLKHPDAGFEQGLAWQAMIFEKAFYEAHKATFGLASTLVMATGPWQITQFDENSGATFMANPHYWGGPVNIQKIELKYFSDQTSEALAFRTGAIDVAFPTQGTAFASASGAKLRSTPATSLGIFGMNTKMGPWSDVHVRRAVAYALDRPALVKALGNPAFPVSTIIPPSALLTLGTQAQVNAALKDVPQYPYSIAKAKAELAKSKYPHGFTSYTDTTRGSVASAPVSEAIAGMLAKIGINLNVRIIAGTPWINELVGPKKFADTFTTFNIGSPDPSGFPGYILGSKQTPSGGWNWANYGPPTMDKLLAEASGASDSSKRLTLYGQILKMVGEDVPYISILNQDYNMALSSKFSWPGFNQNYGRTTWELQVKAAS
jgi:peptide/nickel transport system substrate-binding protein